MIATKGKLQPLSSPALADQTDAYSSLCHVGDSFVSIYPPYISAQTPDALPTRLNSREGIRSQMSTAVEESGGIQLSTVISFMWERTTRLRGK